VGPDPPQQDAVHSDALAAYGRAWNERDPEARAELLRAALAADCRYVDDEFAGTGVDGISAVIGEYHRRVAGFRIRLTSAVEAHHDVLRFTWRYDGEVDGEAVKVEGADTILLDGDGRMRLIVVFFGARPRPL